MLYKVARLLVLFFYKVVFLFRVTGRENLPREGALIICANHISNWDPPTLAVGLDRRLSFLAKAELLELPLIGKFLALLGAYPIRRGKGDSAAVKAAISVLKENRAMVIFPEGTRARGRRPKDAGKGVVRLAIMTGAKILPVGIRGGYRIWGGTAMRIGEAISYQEYEGQKPDEDEIARLANELMDKIYSLAGCDK